MAQNCHMVESQLLHTWKYWLLHLASMGNEGMVSICTGNIGIKPNLLLPLNEQNTALMIT